MQPPNDILANGRNTESYLVCVQEYSSCRFHLLSNICTSFMNVTTKFRLEQLDFTDTELLGYIF